MPVLVRPGAKGIELLHGHRKLPVDRNSSPEVREAAEVRPKASTGPSPFDACFARPLTIMERLVRRRLPRRAHKGTDLIRIFLARARSTPEDTSTPGARVMRKASPTLPASSPPDSMNGTPGARFSRVPVERLSQPTRPCRLARRASVEQQAIGDIGIARDRDEVAPFQRQSPSSPAGRSAP